MSNASKPDWTIVAHLDYSDRATACCIQQHAGEISVKRLASSAASGKDINRRPVFIGCNDKQQALIMEPSDRSISACDSMPADARFAYAYRDPNSVRIWFMNDGDKDGNDDLVSTNGGSSLSIVANDDGNAIHVDTLGVGRGHHVTTFVAPTANARGIPHRAFVSNLKDGTLQVLGNDPNDSISFLKSIATINLCDPRHEKDGASGIPNNAFPHGMEFSALTGKLYNLNNGYGTVSIVDPLSHEIEDNVPMPISSNLLLSRCGGFLIGKGVDRKANAEHVIGRLCVMDAKQKAVVTVLDIEDFYPSVYRFNPKGDRLYVTAAATGQGVQADNLRTDIVQIYDTSALPALRLIKEVKLAPTTSGRRPIAFLQQGDRAAYVFIPNPSHGSLAILDGDSDEVIDTVDFGDGDIVEFSFSFWHDRNIYGA